MWSLSFYKQLIWCFFILLGLKGELGPAARVEVKDFPRGYYRNRGGRKSQWRQSTVLCQQMAQRVKFIRTHTSSLSCEKVLLHLSSLPQAPDSRPSLLLLCVTKFPCKKDGPIFCCISKFILMFCYFVAYLH